MPQFRYRAIDPRGALVDGAIAAARSADVVQYVERLGLVLIDSSVVDDGRAIRSPFVIFGSPRAEDITLFTRDLALLLRAGARINDGLDWLGADREIGRLRGVVTDIRARVVAGESFAEALARHPTLFSTMYVAMVRVGEASGTLDRVLEQLAAERQRAEALRSKLVEAVRYPLFVFGAAACVLLFFMTFVLPQFGAVLQDFGAKVDPFVRGLLQLSAAMRDHTDAFLGGLAACIALAWLALRRRDIRHRAFTLIARLPVVRAAMRCHRTSLFCRNLSVLLGSGVHLAATLRILVDMMPGEAWRAAADRVRHGAKLSDALADTQALPPMAVRMLRLGDETGQLPMLAGRVADFYDAKLQRLLDRITGIAGPAAIILISVVVGGLIVSVMTALMSVSQLVG